MKGLMIKDLKLMKNQKSFAVIFAAVILFYLFTEVTAAVTPVSSARCSR